MRKNWNVVVLGVALFAILLVFAFTGCAGAGQSVKQLPTVNPKAESDLSGKIDAANAKIETLTQEIKSYTTMTTTAITKSAQDNDAFRTQIGGAVKSLTQNQFRFEQWLAKTTRNYRLRILGVDPYGSVTLPDVPAGVVKADELYMVGIRPVLPDGPGGVPAGSGSHSSPAVPDSQNTAAPVKKAGFWWGWPTAGLWW